MIRKLMVCSAAAALSIVVLPALPAAALSGTAALVTGSDVLPGASRPFAVEVTNSDSALLGGQAINAVLVYVPTNVGITTVDGVTAPSGWTVSRADAATYLFRTTGSGIAPGAKMTFPFNAAVAAPFSRDQQGLFKVSVSHDGGRSAKAAGGALTSTIRILDVDKDALRGLSPSGVTDGSGTAGQAITYGVKVTNYARSAVAVTPTLSSNGGDTFSAPSPAAGTSVPAGGSVQFAVPTTLAGSSDRVATFTAGATAPDSAAAADTAAFEVQAPARLALTAGSLSPTNVRPGKNYTFTVGATKSGKPTLTGLTGTLSFAGNSIALAGPTTIADGAGKVLSFDSQAVSGADGTYDADFAFAGRDGNGAPFSVQNLKLTQAVTLDALAPVFQSLVVGLPTDQTAAKNGDTITVSGVLDDKSCGATLDFVELRTDNGQVLPVAVTRDGCSFSGSVSPTFAAGAKSFSAVAQATDAAGNPGNGASVSTLIDNIAPELTYAQTRAANQILVRFTEAGGLVRGGCAASQWKVDGELLVREVRNSDGTACSANQAGPDNDRILVLFQDKDQDYTTNVTYTPGRRPFADPAKDGAAADAVSKTVKTVVGVAPAPAVLLTVTRNAGTEAATLDEGRYFTRFTGSDLRVTFSGARAGYVVQVLDGSGAVLGQQALEEDGSGEVTVPVGSTDAVYDRALRLINTAGIASATTPFKVELDRRLPALSSATLGSNGKDISVLFTEKLAAGTDAAFEWEGWARDTNPDSTTGRIVSPAEKVTGAGNTRTVTIQDTFTADTFGGADYVKRLEDSVRYVDRAGNVLNNTK